MRESKKIILFSILAFLCAAVFASAAESSLAISYSVLDPYVMPGGETTVLLTFTNPSASIGLNSIKLYIVSGEYLSATPGYIELGGLAAGISQQTGVKLKVEKSAKTSISFIRIRAVYFSDSTSKESNIDIPITIRRDPILQIESSQTNESAEPGKTVLFSLALKNNGEGSAKDLKVGINQNEKVFISQPAEAFIKEIQPGESKILQFLLTINPSANIGTYAVAVTLNYYNEIKTVNFSSAKYADLKVSGGYNFIVTLEQQDLLYPGGSGYVTVKAANAGTSEAQFLVLEHEDQTFYAGNLKSDDYDTERILVSVPNSAKDFYPVVVELKYNDPFGNNYAENRSIVVRLISAEEYAKMSRKDNTLLYIAAGVVLIGIGYFFYRRKRKAGRLK